MNKAIPDNPFASGRAIVTFIPDTASTTGDASLIRARMNTEISTKALTDENQLSIHRMEIIFLSGESSVQQAVSFHTKCLDGAYAEPDYLVYTLPGEELNVHNPINKRAIYSRKQGGLA